MSGKVRFSAFVAATEDFDGSAEDLHEAWQDEHPAVYHVHFDVPEEACTHRLVELIAKGLLWEDCWSPSDVVWTVMPDVMPDDTRPLWEDRTGSAKDIDLWDSNVV
jgi:hypothetical protein